MATLAECLQKLSTLADINTGLLKAINESLITKNNYVSTEVDGIKYNIPSFINLENKINILQENFENLIHSPENGEAFFNINGNSRAIVVRDYNNAPASINLPLVENFSTEANTIFKDFLTPKPYLNIGANTTGDITSCVVKKIIPKSQKLIDYFKSELEDSASVSKSYIDIKQLVSNYEENVDYIEYDKISKQDIRGGIGEGKYVIEKILEDIVDDNLVNYITIKIKTDISGYDNRLTYIEDGKNLPTFIKENDILTTWDNSAKLRVVEVKSFDTVKLKVENGEYLNLVEHTNSGEPGDLSKLRFFNDLQSNNYFKIPLEEDQYIFVTIAAYKETMNVRSNWGDGLIIDTYKLTYSSIDGSINFKNYYENNVKNIGDVLYELTDLFSLDYASKLSNEDLVSKVSYKPVINENHLDVVHINKHLNDTATVKSIKSLYKDKKSNEAKLNEIQNKILDVNNNLSSISYDDTTGIRTVYESQLKEYTSQKNEIITAITKNIEAISNAALNSEIPLESAKYRVRGFHDLTGFDDVIGVKVQYRYKNTESTYGGATTIGDKFVFGDWVEVRPFFRDKVYNNGKFDWEDIKDSIDEPSCNQIEIPISQGEIVEIRIKLIYKYNYPLARVESAWSDVVSVSFPEKFLKDIQVTTIIEENNNDIETNRFQNILHDSGVSDHINDKLTDQDLTFFHKPESISSGFYTSERRIIPLKDKLVDLDNMIKLIQNTIDETSGQLDVSIKIGNSKWNITEGQYNEVTVANYSQFANMFPTTNIPKVIGNYILDKNNVVTVNPKISLKNNSNKYIRLYSIFPGPRNMLLSNLINSKYSKIGYVDNAFGIYCKIPDVSPDAMPKKVEQGEYVLVDNVTKSYSKVVYNGNNKYIEFTEKPGSPQSGDYVQSNPNSNIPYYYKVTTDNQSSVGEKTAYTARWISSYKTTCYVTNSKASDGSPYNCYPVVFNGSSNLYDSPVTVGGIEVSKPGYSQYSCWLRKQTANQFITFRMNNVFDGEWYYSNPENSSEVPPKGHSGITYNGSIYGTKDIISSNSWKLALNATNGEYKGATLYPSLNNHNDLCLDDDNKYGYKLIAPGQEILIPLEFMYGKLNDGDLTSISKTMSFDLRTSLYEDPKNYTFRITANYHPSSQEISGTSESEVFDGTDKIYNTTV